VSKSTWTTMTAGPFSLERPSTWDQLDGIDELPVVIAGAMRDSGFRSSLNVAVQSPGSPVEDAVEAGFEQISGLGLDAYLLDYEERDGGGVRAVFTCRVEPFELTIEQWYWLSGDALVVATATAESAYYAKDSAVFDRIVASLEER